MAVELQYFQESAQCSLDKSRVNCVDTPKSEYSAKMDANDSSRAQQFLACTFTLLVIAWATFCLRVYVRVFIVRHIFAEDYMITVGMVSE